MNERSRTVIAVAWYSREQWECLKLVADDPDAFDDIYEQWLPSARQLLLQPKAPTLTS